MRRYPDHKYEAHDNEIGEIAASDKLDSMREVVGGWIDSGPHNDHIVTYNFLYQGCMGGEQGMQVSNEMMSAFDLLDALISQVTLVSQANNLKMCKMKLQDRSIDIQECAQEIIESLR